MDNIQDFLDKLSAIEQKYRGKTKNEDINIFNILFHGHEEVTLHSRFISYLLSSNSIFLELFVREILKIDAKKFNTNGCEVIPNKENKSEYEDIDILIINEQEKQAIIIENKIHAEPSIHKDAKAGYKGQLERYYNTIIKGEDKNERKCKYKCDEDKTFVYYLTLYKEPTDETIGELKEKFKPEKHIIKYHIIQDWLTLCLEKAEKEFLKTIILQYLNTLINMINNDKIARELADVIAKNENWKAAMCFQNNFIHIKWHTIHRFWNELAEKLQKMNYKITKPLTDNMVTKVAHKNQNIPISIEFENAAKTKFYIANDNKGFTYGNPENTQDFRYFRDKRLAEIKFFEFSNEGTFRLLNKENRDEIIETIVTLIN